MAMLTAITEEEIEFMENLCNPVACAETLFHDLDNLQLYSDKEFSHIRTGQMAMMSFEYLIDDKDPKLSKKENFQRLEGAGTLYNFGARRFGKSLISLILDMLTSLIHLDNWRTLYSSYDALHVLQILERVIPAAERHVFLNLFDVQVKRSPNYTVIAKNGFEIQSINMNISSKTAGSNFFGHHTKKLWVDEYSKTTHDVAEKIVDAVSEFGCIQRFSGMTDFTRHSPAGKIYDNRKLKNWICNFPQYISPAWDDGERLKQEQRYGGTKTVAYRTFVLGEVCEDGISVFDMERVKMNYNEKKRIKNFEINKDNFKNFKSILVVERPSNAELCIIGGDIGETAPTEIVISFKINDKHHYTYNITLYNLTDKQQHKIFKYLILMLKAEKTGIDCGDGTGRAIYRRLEEELGADLLFYYDGSKKIAVDIARQEDGSVAMVNGKPEVIEEFMSEWSVKHLKNLLYDEKMQIPQDFKFDTQINSVISVTLSNRTVYECFHKDTQILTENGWKLFKDLDGDDKVLTNTLTLDKPSYVKPINFIKQHYDGEMIEYDGKTLKFCVTPNHKMLIEHARSRSNRRNKKSFRQADELVVGDGFFRNIEGYRGKQVTEYEWKDFIYNKQKFKKVVPIKEWLKFLGWFVAEGGLTTKNASKNKYRISLAQSVKQTAYREDIEETLDKLGITYSKNDKEYILSGVGRWLFEWLSKNCYCGEEKYSYTKCVPTFVKKLSSELIEYFLVAYIKGDGSLEGDFLCGSSSISKQLTDDIHELFLKTGRTAITRESTGSSFSPNTKFYGCSANNLKVSGYNPELSKRIKYNDLVYCVEVPTNIIYVKYKGRSFWCGNCVAPANHLFDGFRVWALTQWSISFNEENYVKRKAFSKAGA